MSGIGTSGNDEIHDDGSAAIIDGGAGDDLLVMDLSTKTAPQTFTVWPNTTDSHSPAYKNIEHLQIVTGSGDDTGDFTDVIYDTTWGGNSWDAGAGNDLADVNMSDTKKGLTAAINGSGQMVITVRSTGDVLLTLTNVEHYSITGGTGNDILAGGAGDDILAGGEGTNTLDGGAGFDIAVMGDTFARTRAASNSDGSITMTEGGDSTTIRNIEAIQFTDMLLMLGTAGNDNVVEVPDVATSFFGDAGNDTYTGSDFQLVNGGDGNDTVIYRGTLASFLDSFLAGTQSVVSVETMQFNDGRAQMGTAGDDTMTVAAGFDFFIADQGNDTITDGQARTEVYGDSGNDIVTVAASDITVDGGAGDDTVVIKAANVTIHGGDGNDSVYLPGSPPDYHAIPGGLASVAGNYLLDSVENVHIVSQNLIFVPAGGTLGSKGDDLFVWSGTTNIGIDGGGGNDTLVLNNANEIFYLADVSDPQYPFSPVLIFAYDGSGRQVIAEIHLNGISNVQFGNTLIAIGTDGNDNFTGTDGNDGYFGGAGDDVLSGGAGDDNLQGGSGHDILDGGDGNDTLVGGGTAELIGGAGDDTLIGTNGSLYRTHDSIADFSGVHSAYTITFSYIEGLATVSGPDGTDSLKDIYTLRFSDGLMRIGTSFGDDITVDANIAFVYSGDDGDEIHYTSGNVVIDGGTGSDTVYLPGTWPDAELTYNADGSINAVTSGGNVTLIGVERLQFSSTAVLVGTSGADTLNSDDTAAVFIGGPGDDTLITGSSASLALFSGAISDYTITRHADGTVTVAGPDGTDTLTGFRSLKFGNATAVFDNSGLLTATLTDGSLRVVGSSGDDNLHTSAGNHDDVLDGGAGFDTFYAGALVGSDIAIAADGTVTVTGPDGTDTLRNIEQVIFNDPNGVERSFRLGTAGNDVVTAKSSGADGLAGGSGDDSYTFVSGLAEAFLGGPGTDTAILPGKMSDYYADEQNGIVHFQENGGYGNYILSGVERMQFANGNGFIGDNGDNVLNGTDTNDLLVGGKGNDQINGGAGFDTALFAGNFSDYSVQISDSNVTVTGPDGTDTLTGVELLGFSGPQSAAVWIGSSGNDDFSAIVGVLHVAGDFQIYGGGGNDILGPWGSGLFDGGDGFDTAVFPYSFVSSSVVFNSDDTITLTAYSTRVVLRNVEAAQFVDGTVLLGTYGDDTMTGTAGSDAFMPGPGNDTINGGGGDDIVLYSGDPSSYSVTKNGDGSYTVTGPDGTDTLRNVEYAGFAGMQISIHTATADDFNADGNADILWQNSDGTAAVWLLNGTTLSGGNTIGNPGSASWKAIGTGDFDGDGKADILWQNTDGTAAVWLMNGSTLSGGGIPGNPGPAWSVLGAADFNGDGKSDILWRDGSGNIAIWLMNGSTLTGGAVAGNPGAGWSYKGYGDFDGDGKTDLVFQNANGAIAIWLMNGAGVSGGGIVGNPGSNWSVKAVGDFDGDGKSDLLLQDASGQAAIWEMSGITVAGGGLAGSNPGTSWTVKQAEDVNGDGKADILWQAGDGSPAVWLMNGTSVTGGGIIGGNPGPAWHVVTG